MQVYYMEAEEACAKQKNGKRIVVENQQVCGEVWGGNTQKVFERGAGREF